MKTLTLADDLHLPIETVTEKLAFLGRTGTGKTYGAMKLAELMLAAGATIGAIDPVGVWRGLRAPATKGGPAFDVVIFGGLTYDLPLEGTQHAGQVVADLVCDRGLSFVLDVSQMIPAEQQQVVRGFAAQFFQRKKAAPGAIHLFMEECQEFLPENPSGQEALTLGVMQRLWKLGRNYGIGGSLISQRPQEIAKKALNMSGTLFAFQMTGPHERKAVKAWIADHDIATDIEAVLRTLKRGQPHVEMQIETPSGKVYAYSGLVEIAKRTTADLSSTPTVVGTATKRPLTQIDVAQLKVAMAESVERAKADDPVELRKALAEAKKAAAARVADLDKQVGTLTRQVATLTAAPPVSSERVKDVKTAAAAEVRALRQQLTQHRAALDEAMRFIVKVKAKEFVVDGLVDEPALQAAVSAVVSKAVVTVKSKVDRAIGEYRTLQTQAGALEARIDELLKRPMTVEVEVTRQEPYRIDPSSERAGPRERRAVPSGATETARGEVAATETLLLDRHGQVKAIVTVFLTVLAQYDRALTRHAWHVLANYMPSGDTSKMIAELVRRGYVEQAAGGMKITESGIAFLGPYDALPTGADLRRFLVESPRLGPMERALMKTILEAYPNAITRAEAHATAGYKPSGDTSKALSKFATVGWITAPGKSLVRASDDLFPDFQ